MLPLAILLVLLAVAFFWLATRQQKIAGLPAGKVIYADTSRWAPVEKPLYDAVLGLAGKPDYLVEVDEVSGNPIIPVEVKSRHSGQVPYDSHIFQLAAYCLLVERQLGQRPPYGILKYPDQIFSIDFTPALEAALRNTLEAMRSTKHYKEVARSHNSPPRCARCGYRGVCDQNLFS
jgi:CRISPR-associated exonuclease Cas4